MIIVSNNQEEIDKLKEHLVEAFEMQDLGKLSYFLGIKIQITDSGIYLSQKAYLENVLRRFGMVDCKPAKTPMEKLHHLNDGLPDDEGTVAKPVRELVGCLMYVMLGTRPDLSVAVNLCSRYQTKPTEKLWKALKRILRYIKGTMDFQLFYAKNNGAELVGFADSDWAGDEQDRKSTTGFLFKAFGSIICWNTKKQSTVAVSSTEAEYVALAEAAREGIWLSNLLSIFDVKIPYIIVFEDNQSCIKLTKRMEHKRLKHVDIKFNFIKDLVEQKRLIIEYISTNDQIADVLTKSLEAVKFCKLRSQLGLVEQK